MPVSVSVAEPEPDTVTPDSAMLAAVNAPPSATFRVTERSALEVPSALAAKVIGLAASGTTGITPGAANAGELEAAPADSSIALDTLCSPSDNVAFNTEAGPL